MNQSFFFIFNVCVVEVRRFLVELIQSDQNNQEVYSLALFSILLSNFIQFLGNSNKK